MKLSLKWLNKLNEILSANDILTKQSILFTLDFRLNRDDMILYHQLHFVSSDLEMDLKIHSFLKDYHQIQVENIHLIRRQQRHVPDPLNGALINRTATDMINADILASKKKTFKALTQPIKSLYNDGVRK